MIKRRLQSVIEQSLRRFPAVGLIGSRQTGKTTLAKTLAKPRKTEVVFLDLERPSDQAKLQDPELYLEQHGDELVVLDEVQQKKNLFPVLRALIDSRRRNGRFLILGSASAELLKQSSESLAGRIIYHELNPFSLDELNSAKINFRTLWLRGGYPLSLLATSNQASFVWREAFLKTYLERDLFQLGVRTPSLQLKRFLQMTAHSHGQLWNHSKIANSLGVSAPTVQHYLDIMTETFILRQLQPFSFNFKKRLVKSPKVYIRDSGLLHTVLQIESQESLQGQPVLGASWEGFVIEQVLSLLPSGWQAYFYRTYTNAELDLLLINPRQGKMAIEIKYSLSPKLSRGYREAFSELKCEKGYVIYPGKESYPLDKKVAVLPITRLAEIVNKKRQGKSG